MGELAGEVTKDLVSEKSGLSLALVLTLSGFLVAGCAAWFGQKARVDALETRVEHTERVVCVLEKAAHLEDADCDELLRAYAAAAAKERP